MNLNEESNFISKIQIKNINKKMENLNYEFI